MTTTDAVRELKDLQAWLESRTRGQGKETLTHMHVYGDSLLNQVLHRQRQERQAKALEVALVLLAKELEEQEGK